MPNQPIPVDSAARRRLPILLRGAWYGLNQAFRRRIAPAELTPDQFTVLRTLIETGEGLIQSELAELMTSDPNTIASLLERMESAGWLDRTPHERDRRALRIRIKAAGERKYSEVRERAIGLQTEVLSVLPESKREEFLRHLAAVADACRDAASQSPRKRKQK